MILTTKNNEEQVANEFMGYSLFEHILNPSIKAWNRANTIYNIKERHGTVVASRYVSKLHKLDMLAVYTIMATVERDGYENVRRQIFRENNG